MNYHNFLFVSHPDGKDAFKIAKERFLNLAVENNISIKAENIISYEIGPVYEIYSLIKFYSQ